MGAKEVKLALEPKVQHYCDLTLVSSSVRYYQDELRSYHMPGVFYGVQCIVPAQ